MLATLVIKVSHGEFHVYDYGWILLIGVALTLLQIAEHLGPKKDRTIVTRSFSNDAKTFSTIPPEFYSNVPSRPMDDKDG